MTETDWRLRPRGEKWGPVRLDPGRRAGRAAAGRAFLPLRSSPGPGPGPGSTCSTMQYSLAQQRCRALSQLSWKLIEDISSQYFHVVWKRFSLLMNMSRSAVVRFLPTRGQKSSSSSPPGNRCLCRLSNIIFRPGVPPLSWPGRPGLASLLSQWSRKAGRVLPVCAAPRTRKSARSSPPPPRQPPPRRQVTNTHSHQNCLSLNGLLWLDADFFVTLWLCLCLDDRRHHKIIYVVILWWECALDSFKRWISTLQIQTEILQMDNEFLRRSKIIIHSGIWKLSFHLRPIIYN